ncbi:MAG: hypothetical protein LBH69_03280 [Methanomassiliicoccaceae archaeon]|jgi:hypothetical protein|nr:hypothetical protein [Methanomassiliicoccaceae archaeon]
MNVKIVAIAAVAIVIVAGLGFFFLVKSPDNNSKDGNDGEDGEDSNDSLDPDMLKGYRAELGGSVSVGIMSVLPQSTQSAASKAAGPVLLGDDPQDDQDMRNRLISVDDDGNISEVLFTKIEVSDDGRPNVIMQGDLDAQIDKLHVTKDFIYFTMTINPICPDCHVSYNAGHTYCPDQPMNSYYSRDYYDRSGYNTTDDTLSFVIDRQSKNVYSLADIPIIHYLDENLITGMTMVGEINGIPIYSAVSVFKLTIEGDHIVITDMVPNKNIRVLCGMVNNDGTIIVANTTMDAADSNVVLCKDDYYYAEGVSNSFVKGSDGNIYKMTAGALKVFDTATMKWADPNLSLHVSIWTANEYILINNGEMYRMNCGNSSYRSYSVWEYVTDASSGDTVLSDKFHDPVKELYRIGETPVCLKDGSLYAYVTASAATSTDKVPLAGNILRMEVIGGMLIAYEERVSGTVTHEVYLDEDGDPQCDIISEIVYDRNLFIIKPLF